MGTLGVRDWSGTEHELCPCPPPHHVLTDPSNEQCAVDGKGDCVGFKRASPGGGGGKGSL